MPTMGWKFPWGLRLQGAKGKQTLGEASHPRGRQPPGDRGPTAAGGRRGSRRTLGQALSGGTKESHRQRWAPCQVMPGEKGPVARPEVLRRWRMKRSAEGTREPHTQQL